MSEQEWRLVPMVGTPQQAVAAFKMCGGVGYTQMVAATPPMPREVWDAMVERAARVLCTAYAACGKVKVCVSCQLDAKAALRAALPSLVIEGEQEDER